MLLRCLWRGARPVCGCARWAGSAWPAAARYTSSSATWRFGSRSRCTGAQERRRAAPGPCRRPSLILKAAALSSARQVKGLDAVFRSVAGSDDGSWLLALLATGLACYGLYCLLEARYRDLTPGR